MEREIIRKLNMWTQHKKTGPFRIQLNPTNRCNLKCRFCWQRTNEEIDYSEVNDERYLDLIGEANALNVSEIEITGGGEPLLRKDLVLKLMEKIKGYRMKGKLITNGTNLNREDLLKIVKYNWDEVVFSVDGTEKTHNYLRQCENCFEDTISSMRRLNELRTDKPKITMHMVLCNENYDEITETVKIASKIGSDNFFIEPVVTLAFDTDMGSKLKMDDEIEEALENIKKSKEVAESSDINHNFDSLKEELINKTNDMGELIKKGSKEIEEDKDPKLKNAACFEPWYNVIIRPEGYVGPCCMFDNEGPNIRENSLEEVWFGEYFENVRERILNHDLLSFCSKCNPSQVSDNREIREMLNE